MNASRRTNPLEGAGRSFRRARTAMVVTGVLAGTLACFAGVAPALATSHKTAFIHAGTSQAAISASALRASADAKAEVAVAKDLNAYYAAGYGVTDSIDLAALWGSPDRNNAKVAAGAKIRAGEELPFAPAGGYAWQYTPDQQLSGYALSDNQGDYAEALRLAEFWGLPDVKSAKTKAGGLVLADEALPIPKDYTSAQDLNAFLLAGYDYDDATKLAQIWHTDSPQSAKVQAGQDLLSLPQIALPIQP